ncbi:DUF3592 domain-containing protein [Haloarcula laminariae]|uniref:DUF3592 domain-containing protein n=1 Tax=Haloarcula laminariae TaxID=2961577 RepID=UPI0021C6ED23|nr:DUF3592 domain-containing protein [Halomicroarcula laminariae]
MASSGTDEGGSGRPPVRPPKPGTAMSVVVLLFGLAFVGVGAYTYLADSARLDGNVAVTAEVTDVGVERVEGSRGRDTYVPTVRFQYRFRGTSYSSDRLYPDSSRPQYYDNATAQERVSAYAVGEEVTAYVDPEAPGEAFLEDTRSGQATGAFVVGLVVCLVGGIGLYQARAQARARDLLS